MLSHEQLVGLHRELQYSPCLSIYVDGNQHDPAQRNKWRTQLERGLDQARRDLASEDEMAAFDAAARRIQDELAGFDAFLPDKAFVAFATEDRLWHAELVQVRMPDLVRWDQGLAAAPYIRGLKQERPVIGGVVDSQRARVFLYRDGGVKELLDVRADTFVGDLTDVASSKRSTPTTGHRGETATDAAQRFLTVATERMVKELAQMLAQGAGDHGFVVLGGTPEMEAWVRDALPKGFEDRVIVDRKLYVGMRETEIRRAVSDSASELTKRWQVKMVEASFDQARAGGRGAMGYRECEKALEEMRVDTLLLSRTRILEDSADADRLIGMAFLGAAHVEEVSGAAAERLDREAEGIAARLRFRLTDSPADGTRPGASGNGNGRGDADAA